MKSTDELKDKVEAVNTLEEKKNIIAQAGMELTDDELDGVAGGKIAYIPGFGGGFRCRWCSKMFKNALTCATHEAEEHSGGII